MVSVPSSFCGYNCRLLFMGITSIFFCGYNCRLTFVGITSVFLCGYNCRLLFVGITAVFFPPGFSCQQSLAFLPRASSLECCLTVRCASCRSRLPSFPFCCLLSASLFYYRVLFSSFQHNCFSFVSFSSSSKRRGGGGGGEKERKKQRKESKQR